jgi:predicted amidophosphoribosyltransferase
MQLCRRSARHRFTQLYDDLQAFYCQIAIVDALAWVIDNAATMLFVAANVSLPQRGASDDRAEVTPALLPVRRRPGSARWHLAVDDIVNTGGLTLEHVVSGLLRHGAGGNGLVEVRL